MNTCSYFRLLDVDGWVIAIWLLIYLGRGYEEGGSVEMCMSVCWALFLKQMENGV